MKGEGVFFLEITLNYFCLFLFSVPVNLLNAQGILMKMFLNYLKSLGREERKISKCLSGPGSRPFGKSLPHPDGQPLSC